MQISSTVVLAGGEGQRLRPLTQFRPKPMLPAATRPILERVLDALIDAGIDDLHLVVGYKRDRVRNHFGPTYRGRTVTYHTQQTQLGSGHALLQAADAIDDDFLVVNGDEVVSDPLITRIIETHSRSNICTLAVLESELARDRGAVTLDGDHVDELVEQPLSDQYRLMNAGVYAFGPSIFSEIERTETSNGEKVLTDTISDLVERTGNVRGVRVDSSRTEVIYPWDILSLMTALLERELGDYPETAESVFCAPSAQVHTDAVVQPPAVIGSESVIKASAVVGPNVAIGQNATIEAGATLQHCVVDKNSQVGANATLADTVTGTGVAIGPNVTVPGGPGDVQLRTTVHENRDLGAVIADRASVGGGATLSPSVLVGPEARISPGATIRDNVDSNTEVRS